MKRLTYLLLLSALLLGAAESALAQTFAVKGVLRDPLGRTVNDGTYTIVFKLYTVETGGTAVWTETHGSVPTKHGVFGVELGTVTALTGVSFVDNYWLGIQVEGEQEMTPRIKLLTNPYSLAVKGENNRFPSIGNVGIGTTTASSKLTGIGDIEISGSRLHVDANDRVGIGTNAPATRLHVVNGISGQTPNANTTMTIDNSGHNFISLLSPNAYASGIYFGDPEDDSVGEISYHHATNAMRFWSNGAYRLTIKDDGKVGIGSTSPDARLLVMDDDGNVGNGGPVFPAGGTWAGKIFNVDDQAGQNGLLVANRWAGADGTAFEVGGLYDNGNGYDTYLKVNGLGRVGIGTTELNSKLSLGAEVNNQLLGLWDSSNSDEWYGFGIAPALLRIQASVGAGVGVFLGATNEVVRINSNGRVGIGTVNPAQPLEVNGNIKVNGNLIFSDNTSFSSAALGGSASSVTNPADVPITSGGIVNVSVGNSGAGFTPHNNTSLNIYKNNHNFISLLTPNDKAGGIYFGDPDNATIGEFHYHHATDSFGWYTAGVYRMKLDSSGNLGVGTASPGAKLEVADGAGEATKYGSLQITRDAANNSNNKLYLSLIRSGHFVGGLGFVPNVDQWGFFNTNTDSPIMLFDGTGSINFPNMGEGLWLWSDNNAFGSNADGRIIQIRDTNDTGGAPDGGLLIEGYTTLDDVHKDLMAIRGSGLVGIGTRLPATRLHVVSGSSGATPHGNTTMTIDNNGHNFISLLTPNTHSSGIYFGDPENVTSGELAYVHSTNSLQYYSNGAYRFYIDGNGLVGIGTTTPTAGLDVQNGPSFTVSANGYLDVNGNTGTTGSDSRNVSIRASNFIVGQEFAAVSDARIKNVIGVSSGKKDLETIEQLEVVDYTYIDVVGKGNRPNKKLVAQQVQEIYPLAVNTGIDFIPNVYQMSVSTEFDAENGRLIIGTEKEHGFAVDDTVRIADDEGMEEAVVRQVIDAHIFAVDREEPIEQVFVYGKRVEDFLSVNYEAVSMLNVSATQELSRRVEELETSNASLQADNAALKETLTRYQTLEAENAVLRTQMLRFESALQRLQEKVTAGDTGEKREDADDELSMTD
ncbi:MAG: tail fiber domain-containing protein [Gemmatimonadetes bacterium]|nr:tail fiber domain-containing protein [Gemmatimonadota bacterium]